MAFENLFKTPRARLETLIEKIQQQRSNVLITGTIKCQK